MNKSVIFILIIPAFLLGLAGGYYLNDYSAPLITKTTTIQKEMKEGNYKNTFADGWTAAREKLKESGIVGTEARALSGEVSEVKGDKVVFSASLTNPLADESLKTRTAVITNDTELVVRKRKSQEQIEKDQAEAREKLGGLKLKRDNLAKETANCAPPAMPGEEGEDDECASAFEEYDKVRAEITDLEIKAMDDYSEIADAKISDIEKGYSLIVTAGEDIAEKKEFKAIKIEARENKAAAPETTAPSISPAPEA